MDPAKMNDKVTLEAESEVSVRRLRPSRAGGHTHLCAEHFKKWRREAYPGERLKTPPWRERWLYLVDIVHHMWRTGYTPKELGWTVLVLILKGTTKTRGIELIETLWKVVEALIDTRLQASLQMHVVLHRFRSIRGMGTDIMELNLSKELAIIYQPPFFLVFLDLCKAYETVDQERILITLGYGVGPHLYGILETFWNHQQVVPINNGFHRPEFNATRGTTQVGLVSLMIFNVVVDNVIRTWLDMIMEDQRVAHDGLGETNGRCLGVLYANNGMVGSQEADWLHHSMNVLVELF